MALVRWQPFGEIDSLQQEMNRLFESLAPMRGEGDGINFAPPVEMEESENNIHLKLEVPGMEPKDLDVQVTKDAVMISGERKSEAKTEEGGMTRSEFRYGKFRRVIPLPGQVENTQVQADYKDGILNLNMPKAEAEKNKVFKVNLG
ncbi:Hsp20/alpha crystallin family protein [Coleofasciculus sp.]|uniref:Hsp20/alpha crystallin family protein n=1 Tax=Coleofasciculus sp. TaxID=3100458 RepID=UPI003A39BF0D